MFVLLDNVHIFEPMKKEENIEALHSIIKEFREWVKQWDIGVFPRPDSVDGFVEKLSTRYKVQKINDGKYYTPTIEEFYVGFEYEVKKEDAWFRCFYSQGSIVDLYYNYNDDFDSINFNKETIRVKYLDKEDIESLGFKHEVSDNAGGYWVKSNYTLNYYFKHSSLPNNLIITLNDHGNNIVLFNGIIKNKSELIKLLKQLSINE